MKSLLISMLLKNLIKNISIEKNITISGLSTNSKTVKKNYIFFAIKGNNYNGENFINDAIKNGASVVVCSHSCKFKSKKIIIVKTKKIRDLVSEISSKFYKLKPKNIYAVTGTNGKTSIAETFYQILKMNKIPVASIGTFGVKFKSQILRTNLTSPDTIFLHKHLSNLKKKKIDHVIIEASSHGLDQKRLHNINFKAAIFTNFSQDHLDYHKSMKLYLNAKLILFKEILNKNSTIITDKKIKPFDKLKRIAKKRNLKLVEIEKSFEQVKITSSNTSSKFKMKNLAMTIELLKLCGLKEELIFKSIKKLKDISGRLELVKKYPNNIHVYVDYAHTPDALFKTLKSLKEIYGNNINLVFGCGGDRDKKKRPLMGRIANANCKKIYITDDNPRNERPGKIRAEIAKYISKNKIFNVGNRAVAIKNAIQKSNPQEVILIAGKGHEKVQIYKNKIIKISDKKSVSQINIKSKTLSQKKQRYFHNNLLLKKITGKKISVSFDGLSIDTRTLKKDNLFLALKGKKFDGNKFVKQALKKKAGCIVSTSNIKKKSKKIIKVNNSVFFLKQFAKLKRKNTLAKIIAITGSAGKTSLKDLIKNLLSDFGKTYSSPRSFNNHLGVPVSLSNLSFDDKFGVFEVGMSRAGEIKTLSNLIKPHIGVITNIGEAHLENFKDIKGIAKAKSEMIESVTPGGTIILNRDDKFFNLLYKKAKFNNLKILSFGSHKKSDICIRKLKKVGDYEKIYVTVKSKKISFEIKDLNIYNVLASLAVLSELKVNFSKIISKFKKIESSEGRGKKYFISRYRKKFKFIDESYNANPLSVKYAINKLGSIKKEKFKKYLILGDMLELGKKTKKYHQELSKVINNSDIDKVFVKGKKTIFTYKYLNKDKRGNILQNNEDIDLSLSKMISNNDYLMIKGSNATGLNVFSKKMIKGT